MQRIWSNYMLYANLAMTNGQTHDERAIEHWRNRLFVNAMIFALPVSLFAVIPSIIIEYNSGYFSVVLLDVIVINLLGYLVLNRSMNLRSRKFVVALLITFFSVVLFALMGSFNMGSMYLFALSICIALQYTGKAAFVGVIVNAVICIVFALILKFHLFALPMLSNTTLSEWLLYSSNFLFVDLTLVALLYQLLKRLESILRKESLLHHRLQRELILKTDTNKLLTQSEEHYKTLFSQSPLPICIYDKVSLRFLQVNEAATQVYAYTEAEFLKMSLMDIQLQDRPDVFRDLNIGGADITIRADQNITQHVKKDGQLIHVELKDSDFAFEGKPGKLLISTDITHTVNHAIAIKVQNEKLKKIAHMHSHIVRVPLANIMGLSNLIMEEPISESQKDLFNYLQLSIKQLDDVVRGIINDKHG